MQFFFFELILICSDCNLVRFFELIKTAVEINSFAGYFWNYRFRFGHFFEPSSPHNSQRIDGNRQHNEDNTYYHIITHAHTTKHNQTQTHHKHHQTQHPFPAQMQAHFIPSGTRLAQKNQDSCFLHDANMIAQRGMGHGPRTLALRASQGRVCRERRLDV